MDEFTGNLLFLLAVLASPAVAVFLATRPWLRRRRPAAQPITENGDAA